MEEFATLQEITENYCISRKLVKKILVNYKVDCYGQDDKIYINLKDFYQIYSTKYNPALFTIEEKVDKVWKSIFENKLNRTFFNFFSEPVNCKQNLRNLVMAYAE